MHRIDSDLPISVPVILAVASVGIYGFVLAGWSSNSPYSLLGALRSSAQMISYELAMGMALVAVFLHASSMSTAQIVDVQGQPAVHHLRHGLRRPLHRDQPGAGPRHRGRPHEPGRPGRRPRVPLSDRRGDGTPAELRLIGASGVRRSRHRRPMEGTLAAFVS